MRQAKPSSKRGKTRAELNEASWELKRKKKHRGHQSGSRNNSVSITINPLNQQQIKDPRIGSKKNIPLISDETKNVISHKIMVKEDKPRLSLEQQLEQLENDELLNTLLDKLDNNKSISLTEQAYVDKMLDKINNLMNKLGISIIENDNEDENTENILHLLKQN